MRVPGRWTEIVLLGAEIVGCSQVGLRGMIHIHEWVETQVGVGVMSSVGGSALVLKRTTQGRGARFAGLGMVRDGLGGKLCGCCQGYRGPLGMEDVALWGQTIGRGEKLGTETDLESLDEQRAAF